MNFMRLFKPGNRPSPRTSDADAWLDDVDPQARREAEDLMRYQVVLLKPKPAFLRWAGSRRPRQMEPEYARLLRRGSAYLVPFGSGEPECAVDYVSQLAEAFLAMELKRWHLGDEALPPSGRRDLFGAWFDIEAYSFVIDMTAS
jgi:hypothetical protein